MNKFILKSTFLLAYSILIGCGGGSGSAPTSSSSSSSPPTPQPSPPASGSSDDSPVIEYKLNKPRVYEEGFIIIDASESKSGSASFETIDIVQTSGLAAKRLDNLNSQHWLFLAPDLDIDGEEVLSFEINAKNYDGLTATESFDLTVTGRSGAGTLVGEYDPPLDLLIGTGPSTTTRVSHETVIAKRRPQENFNSDKSELIFPGGDDLTKDYSKENIIKSEELLEDVSSIERGNMGLLGVFASSLSIMNQVNNSVDWLILDDQNITDEGEDDRQYRKIDEIEIEAPCFLAPMVSLPQDYVLIGQTNRGFSRVNLNELSNAEGLTRGFDAEIEYTIGEGHSFCHFLQTELPDDIAPWNVDGRVALPPIITVDYNSNDLVLIGDPEARESYEIIDKIPLDTGTDKTLKVVRVYSAGSPSQWPRWMVILLADDSHIGDHRLMLITQDFPSAEISQTRIELGDGIPSELLIGNYGGVRAEDQFAEDLVVMRSSSPTALFFDNIGTNTMTTADNPAYAEAVEFEIGEGAGTAVSVEHRGTLTAMEQILVSFPETGELRLFTVDPENDPEINPFH